MRIATFNVNGLRSIKDYYKISSGWTFDQFLDSFDADIICFQEIKVNEANKLGREFVLPAKYTAYYAFQRGAKKIGYSGVGTLCREDWRPIEYEDGFTGYYEDHSIGARELVNQDVGATKLLDGEGRCIISNHGLFVLFNVYFPNDSGPERQEYRTNFYSGVFERCRMLLEQGRSLLIAGDFNVTWHPMDHCDYAGAIKRLVGRLGMERMQSIVNSIAIADNAELDLDLDSDIEMVRYFYNDKPLRRWFYQLLHTSILHEKFGLRDAFRDLHSDAFEQYTCWNTMVGARGTNHGTRIDSVLLAGPLFYTKDKILTAGKVWSEFMGSDHCPVIIDLNLEIDRFMEKDIPRVMPRNLTTHHKQRRLSDFFSKASSKPVTFDQVNQSPTVTENVASKKARSTKLSDFPLINCHDKY